MKTHEPNRNFIRGFAFLMRWLLRVSLILLITGACKKSGTDTTPVTPTGGVDPSTITGAENLGAGYDVFDNYADGSKVKATILDFSKLNKDNLIQVKTIEGGSFSTCAGTSIDEYSSSLSVMASLSGSYMYFSGAIKTNFDKTRYQYEAFSFATVKSLIEKTQIRLPLDMTPAELKPYLTATFKSKLNDASVSPATLFTLYGTHCMTGIMLGGRLDYSVSDSTSDLTEGKSISVYAEADFSNNVATISGSVGVVTTEEYNKYLHSCRKILHVYGGRSEFGQQIINKDNYDDWINSIADHSVLCNFAQYGLVPIWEFCESQSRKSELMAAFQTWADDRKITVYSEPRWCILDVKVEFGFNTLDPLPINGRLYHRIKADLNCGCGGSTPYIFLYYLLGQENDPDFNPLAELCTIDDSDGESLATLPGKGWEQVDGNLNKGAGGDNIYFAIRRITEGESMLTGLRVELENETNFFYSTPSSVSNQWLEVAEKYNGTYPQDLNEGAGGYNIFIWHTHDLVTPPK
jgi:hypothetical protein